MDVRRDNAAVQPRDRDPRAGYADAAGAAGQAVVNICTLRDERFTELDLLMGVNHDN